MIWFALMLVLIAGLIGGAINALLTDNGFILPKYEKSNGTKIARPGYLGNMLIGGVAAVISWGMYGPAATFNLLSIEKGQQQVKAEAEEISKAVEKAGLTVSGFVGGMLIGVAGARWLTNEVDKSLLRAAASQAARANKSDALAATMATVPPAEALRAANAARDSSS